MGFALLGCILFACSHAIYVREKTSFYANHPLSVFEESTIVKFLDIAGGTLFLMPWVMLLGNMIVKIIVRHTTFTHEDNGSTVSSNPKIKDRSQQAGGK